MIRLKKIVRNNNEIECEIYPENSKVAGKLYVDIVSGFYSYKLPEGYEWCTNHVTHAKNAILVMVQSEKQLPTEKLVMWG